MAGLGALGQLNFDHFDRRQPRLVAKAVGAKMSGLIPATKISGADLPDQVAAAFEMVGTDPTFAGIVIKATGLGAAVKRQNSVAAECPKTHGRNVENAGLVRLAALGPTDGDP